MTTSHLRYTAQAAPGVAVIDIDRSQAHNALDRADQYHFDELLAAALADPDVRCLVLAGTGGKALSAGWRDRAPSSRSPPCPTATLARPGCWPT